MSRKKQSPPKEKQKQQVKFKYIIPDHIQDCHVSGVYGGMNPKGEITMHFFNERPAIPKEAIITIDDDGTTAETKHTFGADLIRIIQASMTVDFDTAVAIHEWMGRKIEKHQKLLDELMAETTENEPKEDGK